MYHVCTFVYGDSYRLAAKNWTVWTGTIEPGSDTAALLVEPGMYLEVDGTPLEILGVERFATQRPGSKVGIALDPQTKTIHAPNEGDKMRVLATPKCSVCGTRTKMRGGDPNGPSPYEAGTIRGALDRNRRAEFPYKCPNCGREER